jgi:hypothetical protein
MIDIAQVTSVLTAAGFGSILGSMLAQGKDRRLARAEALKAVNAVERLRWAPTEWDEFVTATHDASAALLLAQVPQRLSRGYLEVAFFAYFLSTGAWVDQTDVDPEQRIPQVSGGVSKAVRSAARVVVTALWHPWVGGTIGILRMRRILLDIGLIARNLDAESTWIAARSNAR